MIVRERMREVFPFAVKLAQVVTTASGCTGGIGANPGIGTGVNLGTVPNLATNPGTVPNLATNPGTVPNPATGAAVVKCGNTVPDYLRQICEDAARGDVCSGEEWRRDAWGGADGATRLGTGGRNAENQDVRISGAVRRNEGQRSLRGGGWYGFDALSGDRFSDCSIHPVRAVGVTSGRVRAWMGRRTNGARR